MDILVGRSLLEYLENFLHGLAQSYFFDGRRQWLSWYTTMPLLLRSPLQNVTLWWIYFAVPVERQPSMHLQLQHVHREGFSQEEPQICVMISFLALWGS